MIYRILLLASFASCESAQEAPLVPHGLVVLKATRVDFAAEGEEAAAARRPSPSIWLNAGGALLCEGEYEKAGEALAKGLKPSKATGRQGVQATWLGNLGQAHQRLGRLDSALVFLPRRCGAASAERFCHWRGSIWARLISCRVIQSRRSAS